MALCTINLRAYPYDTQVCNITLGSWTFQDSNVNTTIDKKGLFEREAGDYSEWDVAGNRSFRFAKTYECCKGQFYTSIVLELTLKRRPSGVFCYAVILPQAVAFLLTLLQFWVPAKYIKTRFIALTVAIALSFATIHFIVGQLGSLTSGTPYSGKNLNCNQYGRGFNCSLFLSSMQWRVDDSCGPRRSHHCRR